MTAIDDRSVDPVDLDGPLGQFIAQAVADDYADVEPAAPGAPARRTDRGLPASLAAVGVAVLIGLIGAIAILTVRATDDAQARTHDELEQRVAAVSAGVEERQAAVDAATDRVDDLRNALLDSQAADAQSARIDRLAMQAGTSELSGPGLTVTIDDAPDAAAQSLNRVLDRDLQVIVNALWKIGATGIAINGQRLTAQSAIRSAGDAILVDYQPVLAPYRIDALGTASEDPDDNDLMRLLDGLRTSYGLESTVVAGDVALPAGELRTPHYAAARQEGSGS